jgi:hypothetical protein
MLGFTAHLLAKKHRICITGCCVAVLAYDGCLAASRETSRDGEARVGVSARGGEGEGCRGVRGLRF